MEKIRRGRFSLSVNIIMTTSLITRVFTFGLIMMSIYIKVGDDILDDDVIKVVDTYDINGIHFGSAVKSLIFSLAGVFGLDLLAGISAAYGVFKKKKQMLAINVILSSLLLIVYCIYIVFFSIIYDKRTSLQDKLHIYSNGYTNGYLSSYYRFGVYPGFIASLGCYNNNCYDSYINRLKIYIQTYFGLIVTCCICQVISIVAVEYTFRKLELKEKQERISQMNYKILCTIRLGIMRSFVNFIKESWKWSKPVFLSVVVKMCSLIAGAGLLVLGIIMVSHEFIINLKLKSLFYRLQFYDYYLYDIFIGVTASCIVLGIATVALAITGLVGSWRHSPRILQLTTLSSFTLHLARISSVIIWIVFLEKINDNLRVQLEIQQTGYYRNSLNDLTVEWNTMIQKLDCCGVNHYTDTWTTPSKTLFCYENAKEILAYPSEIYDFDYNLRFTVGLGGVRTTTCTSKIKFQLRMMIGWFVAITLLQIVLEILGIFLVNKEFRIYREERHGITLEKTTGGEQQTSKHIVTGIICFIRDLVIEIWKRSKARFWCLVVAAVYILLNVGLLVISIHIRYDNVLGNRYIKDYILTAIDIAGYSLSSLLDNFHIVVTTFALASLAIGIYVIVLKVLRFDMKVIPLYLVVGLVTISFTAHIVLTGLWGKIHVEISNGTYNGLLTNLEGYAYADNSLTYNHIFSAAWNILFLKAKCCGAGSDIRSSFYSTSWYRFNRKSSGQSIPEYCCNKYNILYPYSVVTDTDCTTNMLSGTYHDQVCDTAIKNKFDTFSIPYFVLTGLTIIIELAIVVTTVKEIMNLKKNTQIPILFENEVKKAAETKIEDVSKLKSEKKELTTQKYETSKTLTKSTRKSSYKNLVPAQRAGSKTEDGKGDNEDQRKNKNVVTHDRVMDRKRSLSRNTIEIVRENELVTEQEQKDSQREFGREVEAVTEKDMAYSNRPDEHLGASDNINNEKTTPENVSDDAEMTIDDIGSRSQQDLNQSNFSTDIKTELPSVNNLPDGDKT